MTDFKGILLSRNSYGFKANYQNLSFGPLAKDEVEFRVTHSTLNFKDALAITGAGPIVKTWPMVPGIDCVGFVEDSESLDWRKGDPVVVTGWGLGETSWGGLAQRCRIKADWALPPPKGFNGYDCMVIGTAGVTAAMSVIALQRHAYFPEQARVLVTGAAGGVGSIAVALLASLGHHVTACTGRTSERDYLERLGARDVIARDQLDRASRPLESEQWDGVVDTVGGRTLATACAATRWNGAVAACGLAGSADFPVTVMPFILRGVTLYGINSVYISNAQRERAWTLLVKGISRPLLSLISSQIPLGDVIAFAPNFLAGAVRGRTVVRVDGND